MELTLKAHAKINLSLDILGRRPDGYHLVEMVLQPIELHDLIILTEQSEKITLSTDHPDLPTDEENLALRAALLLKPRALGQGVHIHIKKRIPMAAGLGGGSADAAAVLLGLNQLWELNLTLEELLSLGLSLGADVPFCLLSRTALARGIGEELTPLPPPPPAWLLLVKPPYGISTAKVYQHYDPALVTQRPRTPLLIEALASGDWFNVSQEMVNVLETVTFRFFPDLLEIKNLLLGAGALGSMMSGSGTTVFGLFQDQVSAQKAAEKLLGKGNIYLTRTLSAGEKGEVDEEAAFSSDPG